MKKTLTLSRRQAAQIGITAVLLTTVLLAIGVSVTTRMVSQTQQETSRQESTGTLNQAESGAANDQTISDNNIYVEQTTSSSVGEGIEIQAGDTIEIDGSSVSGNITIDWSGCGANQAALLISKVTSGNIEYYPIACSSCDGGSGSTKCGTTGPYTGFVEANYSGDSEYPSRYTISADPSAIYRVKVLFQDTNIRSDGLTKVTRSAAANEAGGEVRVVEQRETAKPAAPSVFDYGIFVANGSITQDI